MTRNIENLVFKGGGVLGIAYAGAIEILENEGILTQVQRTAGTSAGAVAAALISLGYSSKEII
ncbi:MAG TPA: patatin, partial [Bacteroidetes bacterium]|nr:patatin [Bacteroidota bacterium]